MIETTVLRCSGIGRSFRAGDGSALEILADLDFAVERGEFVAIVGSSGSGKSTLLHILGGLDRPDNGDVELEGRSYRSLDQEALAALRNRRLGFVFQFHHLLRDFTAVENVAMPLRIAGVPEGEAMAQSVPVLQELGLGARLDHRVTLLSGGEQQRVALARAVVHRPAVLLADEPSGNLDPPNAAVLHQLLRRMASESGVATVIVTHDRELAAMADRVLTLRDGRLEMESV